MIRLRVAFLLSALLALPFHVLAASPPASPTSGTVVLSVTAPFELRRPALGLTLLLRNAYERKGVQVATTESLDQALHETKAWRPDRTVLTSAIPELGARLGATAFIQGLLEEDGLQWRLTLRAYDVIGGYDMESQTWSAKAGDVAWLLAKSAESLDAWLDLPPINDTPPIWQATPAEAESLASLELAKTPFDEKAQQQLLEVLAATPQADRYGQTQRAAWRRRLPENGGPLTQALAADLDGKSAPAISFYSSVRPQEPIHVAAMIRAALLEHQAFQRNLADDFLRSAAHPKATVIRAQWFLNDDKVNEAEAALSSLPEEAWRAEVFMALAERLTDATQVARQARAYEHAAIAAYADSQHGLAAQAAYELVKRSPSRLVPDWIDTLYYARHERVEMAEALSGLKQPPSLLLANLLNTGNTAAAAYDFYERAVRLRPFHALAFAQAASYLGAQPNDAGKAELYAKVALALEPGQTSALRTMVQLLAKTGRCADAQPLLTAWAERTREPIRSRFLADVALQCQQPSAALPLLDTRLREAPEDAEALRLMVRAQAASNRYLEAELYYAKLQAVDKPMALELGPPKRPTALTATPPKVGSAESASPPASDEYGDLQSLRDELQANLASGPSPEVHVDLAALADASQNLPPEEWRHLSEKLGLKSNVAAAQGQLAKLYAKNPNARGLVSRGAGASLVKALREMAAHAEAARKERERMTEHGGAGVLSSHPLLFASAASFLTVALGFLMLYLYRRFCCRGVISVKLLYNRSYHAGFFVARLSPKEREIGFRTITRYWKQSRLTTFAKLQKWEQWIIPWQAIAIHDTLNFRFIPAGDYVLNIASIQIDPQTLLPIGSVELKTPVHVTDGAQQTSVRLDEEMAYVGVVIENRLLSFLPGSEHDDVTVYVTGDKEMRAAGHLNEELGFHLPSGGYTILAFAGPRRFSQPLVIRDDFRSQWVRFRLEDN